MHMHTIRGPAMSMRTAAGMVRTRYQARGGAGMVRSRYQARGQVRGLEGGKGDSVISAGGGGGGGTERGACTRWSLSGGLALCTRCPKHSMSLLCATDY